MTTKKMKYCSKCLIVKELEEGYYKAGSSWQKLCKICHNESRIQYASNKVYTPKITGFLKLPEDLQNKIIYDIYVRINFKDIYKKYKDEYPQIKHQTLLKWNREGQIKTYIEVQQKKMISRLYT
jgi:hypothetical protein